MNYINYYGCVKGGIISPLLTEEKKRLEAVKEALRRMRHRRERFALYHGKGSARNPPKSTSTVKMIATGMVDFITQDLKKHDGPSPNSEQQQTTAPSVVFHAMECQQHRGEVSGRGKEWD